MAAREGPPYPIPVAMVMTCDGDHGLFGQATQTFDDPAGNAKQYSDAMAAGWKEDLRSSDRRFLCPACSGKKR